MSKLVFVYTIPRPTANGMSQWVSASGVNLKKTKVGRAKDRISALYSSRIGGLLNYISHTPWLENGKPVLDESGKELTLQDQAEKKWNLPKGYLTNKPWRKGESMKESDMTYFQKKAWSMEDGCTVLDLEKFEDEMQYYVLLASQFCANSEKEWRSHKWPKALYYIAMEAESDDIKYQKIAQKGRAIASLHDSELTADTMRKMVSLLNLASTKSPLNDKTVYNLLYEFIDNTTFTVGSNLDKFNFFFSMLKSPKTRAEFEARFILKKAIDHRVIYEKQGAYFWLNGQSTINIGDRIEEAVDFLTSPKRKKELDDIQAQIKSNS